MTKIKNNECDPLKIAAFVNGQLDPEEVDFLRKHMDHCKKCENTFQMLLALRINAPTITNSFSKDLSRFSPRFRDPFRWQLWTVAAAILLLMLGGLYVMRFIVVNKPQIKMVALLEKTPYRYYSPVMRGDESKLDPEFESLMDIYNEGRYNEFIPRIRLWISKHPNYDNALFYEGVALYLTGKNAEAAKILERAIRIKGKRSAEILWYLSNADIKAGKLELAKSNLSILTKLRHPYAKKARKLLDLLNEMNR